MDISLSRIPGGDAEYLQTLPPAELALVQPSGDPDGLFGKEGVTFHDVLDMINPLQHLPIVGTIYREITGDTMKLGSRVIGGLLFGGPVGMASAAINGVIEFNTGHDIGGELVAMVRGQPLVTEEAQARVAAAGERRAELIANYGLSQPPGSTATAQLASAAPQAVAASDAATGATAATSVPTVATTPVARLAAVTPAKGSLGAPAPNLTPASLMSAATATGTALPANLNVDPVGTNRKTGLPTAGSMTPAAIAAMLAPAPATTASNSLVQPQAIALAGAAAAQRESDTADRSTAKTDPATAGAEAASDTGQPALRMPPRLSVEPRMPGPGRANSQRASYLVPNDAVTAAKPAALPTTPSSDAAIILGTPNAAPASTTPVAQIPDAMLRALDKYDALIKNRRGGAKLVDQRT